MRLLLVEDDVELGRRLSERLRAADFAVELATSRSVAEDWPDVDQLGAIILDLGLPDGDGLDLVRYWRGARVETPIVILTARGSWQDKVEGLNAGADDYVVKPFQFEELEARLNVLLRRSAGFVQPSIRAGSLKLDLGRQQAFNEEQPLQLTAYEYRLLEYLMRNADRVVSRTMLLEAVWDYHFDPQTNVIDVHVSRLRQKIDRGHAQPLLHTVRGAGYLLGIRA